MYPKRKELVWNAHKETLYKVKKFISIMVIDINRDNQISIPMSSMDSTNFELKNHQKKIAYELSISRLSFYLLFPK